MGIAGMALRRVPAARQRKIVESEYRTHLSMPLVRENMETLRQNAVSEYVLLIVRK